ncbi:MAG: DUF493 domain-containing protein [Pseudomonadota bacterium]
MTEDANNDSDIMQFPMDFPIKLIGRDDGRFHSIARELLEPIIGPVPDEAITESHSREGTYIALTVTFTATSREQLDKVYFALSSSDDVLFSQ